MLNVTTITQTCGACPSQWEGRLDDGRYLYVRYRFGTLRCSVGPTLDDAIFSDAMETVYIEQAGDDLDGFMTYEDLRERVAEVLTLPVEARDELDWTDSLDA